MLVSCFVQQPKEFSIPIVVCILAAWYAKPRLKVVVRKPFRNPFQNIIRQFIISGNNSQLDRFLELYAEGVFDIGKVKSKVDPLEEEKTQLTHELKELKTAPKLDKSEAVELALSVADITSEGNTDELRAAINELIESIVIDEETVRIYWKF